MFLQQLHEKPAQVVEESATVESRLPSSASSGRPWKVRRGVGVVIITWFEWNLLGLCEWWSTKYFYTDHDSSITFLLTETFQVI